MEQRSEEWIAEKLGKITGTRAAYLMGSPLAQKTLMSLLISEIAMAQRKASPLTQAMKRGIDMENEAREYYEITHKTAVKETAYIEHPKYSTCGCSPDGLVGENGGIEIKCLLPENHVRVFMIDDIDKKYAWQIKWNLFCTGREYWDYFGYCSDLPGELAYYEKRFYAKDIDFEEIEKKLLKFTSQLNEFLDQFNLNI